MEAIRWRGVASSNVAEVGWPTHEATLFVQQQINPRPNVVFEPRIMFVRFANGHVYGYIGVSRQRAVAATRAPSVGHYINERIKPAFACVQIPELQR